MRSTLAFLLILLAATIVTAAQSDDSAAWKVYILNDNCPDYTWGLTEEQTRQAFADIVRGHLNEMNRTDKEAPENRDRYNMAVTQEALCFVEKYPGRKDELVRRIKEGRVFVSPYLCNSLWGLASVEQAIRTFYPARRLEREWGIPRIEWAEHIEEPSLPWGTATILAGCGIRWLSNPFYNYDSTFSGLRNPPLFIYEGPDGSKLRVVMDPWACNKASYTQGAQVLNNPQTLLTEWLPHYRSLGAAYPVRAILASGTHGDISPTSGGQARGFAEKIAKYNAASGEHPKLVNATLPMFCQSVDEAQAKSPFLTAVRGDFGHSWDAWPVSLAAFAGEMRYNEQRYLAAEALIAVVGRNSPELWEAASADRRKAEWCWAMLSDHAWNGTDEKNQRDNARLREKWNVGLRNMAHRTRARALLACHREQDDTVTVFNPLSMPRGGLVRMDAQPNRIVMDGERCLPTQVEENVPLVEIFFVSPPVPAYGTRTFRLSKDLPKRSEPYRLRAGGTDLESPYYSLKVDPKTGGIISLVHKPSGTEVVTGDKGRTLCQTVRNVGGQEVRVGGVKVSSTLPVGFIQEPVSAWLVAESTLGEVKVTTTSIVYAEIDRVDIVVRVTGLFTSAEERLCQVFPVMREGAALRIETPGAVMRPRPQPEGDLLPEADTRRFAVQGFVDVSLPGGPGVTIVPRDAFLLRQDLGPITFEALGNDQNYKEVIKDQYMRGQYLFWYSLRVHPGAYSQAEAVAFSRDVMSPLVGFSGAMAPELATSPVEVDPARAIATALKPADDPAEGGVILRLWETAGKAGPLAVQVRGFKRAILTDLLERDLKELKAEDGAVNVDLRPHGFAALRLLP